MSRVREINKKLNQDVNDRISYFFLMALMFGSDNAKIMNSWLSGKPVGAP